MRSIIMTAVIALLAAGSAAAQVPDVPSVPDISQPGWLGIGLACSDCGLRRDVATGRGRDREVSRAWSFHSYPALTWLDSDGPAYRAGLRAGDTITAIDGHDLKSADGGRAFANIAPDQHIELTYRRDGRTQRARLTVGTSPEQRAMAGQLARIRVITDSARAVVAAHQDEIRRAQRDMIRAEQEMSRLQMRMQQQRFQGLDSLHEIQSAQLDSAQRRVEEAQRTLNRAMESWGRGYGYGYGTGKCLPGTRGCNTSVWTWTAPTAPTPPDAPTGPVITVTPNVNVAPFVWGRGDAVRSVSSEDFASFGRLRYSGRLGANIIEARAPGAINAVEEGDSVIVITSGDMSVRVLLRQTAPAPARGR